MKSTKSVLEYHNVQNIISACLTVIILSLTIVGCGEQPVSVTQPPTAIAGSPPSPTLELDESASKIDELLTSLTAKDEFTGAVLVARNGEILLSHGYGLADRDNNLPNTPQTKFRLASITKEFTAAAILMLQEQHKLNVEDPICRYIPDCPAAWQEITIHHLLSHTSGIPNITDFPDFSAFKATPSPPDQTIERFRNKPLDFEPGEKGSYSNSGYVLLGTIIEQASGQSYESFLQKYIFEPVQMNNSGYDHNDGALATGYTGSRARWETPGDLDMSLPFAAGGLYSTIEDLYLWDQALYTERLLSQESLDRMFTSQAMLSNLGMDYGYGWFIQDVNNRRVLSHSGGIEGFATEMRRYPDDKVTIIILSNRDTTNVIAVGDQIARIVFTK
ncbi:MAG TPA: serine hydrolase domain-containing protein [Anaerolineales bacterium]|nr:serine hydrolase domain-containing protein [Anaerolineales bacterium]